MNGASGLSGMLVKYDATSGAKLYGIYYGGSTSQNFNGLGFGSSGLLYYKLQTATNVATRKMTQTK